LTPLNPARREPFRNCVQKGHAGSDDQIREHMSGNLCRCGAYPKIVAAIRDAAPQMERG
jgi:xanthine dehydrogenase YagT iron-sulfur-binding subunit